MAKSKTSRRPKKIGPTKALVRIQSTRAEMSPAVEVYHYAGECCYWWPDGWHCPWFTHGIAGSRCYLFGVSLSMDACVRLDDCVQAEIGGEE